MSERPAPRSRSALFRRMGTELADPQRLLRAIEERDLRDRPALEREYVAPRTPTEEILTAIWASVLGLERVGVHDDFFTLGGQSLLATQVLSRSSQACGVELPVRTLFEARTPEALARHIEEARRGTAASAPPLRPRSEDAPLPLSFAQERLWFLDRLQPGNTAYNVPVAFRLRGALDAAALAGALGEVVRRHEALRTAFPDEDGIPAQRILPAAPVPLPVADLASLAPAVREDEARRLAAGEPTRPFDLAGGALVRALLLRLDREEHLLLLDLHHIVVDGWSLGVLIQELGALYPGLAAGDPPRLPALPVQYADWALWQRSWLAGEVLATQLAWWRERLAAAPAVLDLPADRSRPALETFRGARRAVALPPPLAGSLAALARERGATPFMVLLAGFAALLQRLTGEDDLIVGTPVAGRTRPEIEPLIGLFVNMLPLRLDLSGEPAFEELLARVRESALGAFDHQDLPFEKLVEKLRPARDPGRSPIFQAVFILQNQNQGVAPQRTPGLAIDFVEVDPGTARFDLTLSLRIAGGGLAGHLEYRSDLFDGATAERWISHLTMLLETAAGAPRRRVSDLPLLREAERRQLIAAWSHAAPLPEEPVHRLVAAQAAREPGAVAFDFQGEQLTRGELIARAGRLARRLQELGVGPEVLAGIAVERSLDLPVAVLGVLMSGGAYLPLDPAWPADRLAFMLADSGARVLITHRRLADALPPHGAAALFLDDVLEALEPGMASEVATDGAGPDRLAYAIYTSGSTGQPKGVLVTHGGLANFLVSMLREPGLRPEDRLLALTSLSFDIAALELFLPLLAGARAEIASTELAGDGARLLARLRESGITAVQATPATWRMLLEAGWGAEPRLRLVLCGGEALPAGLAAELRRRSDELWNVYGPTETTVWSTALRVEGKPDEPEPAGAVPLGRPLANTAAHVLDRWGNLAPPGVPGELWIGGAGLARGYLARPGLTAERFVPDAFATEPGARLYRTGDLVRVCPDGRLEFLGRIDHQMKIRGHRIELGEIEAALRLHPPVAQAVVVAREDRGDWRLVAYVVPAAGGDAAPAALRIFLRGRLPAAMVPSAFVVLPALPLTPNRKVDRTALPAPEEISDAAAPVAPRSPAEEVLAGIWAEVLGVERVGIDDDFFTLGGHSLLATRIASRVARVLGTEPPVRWIFERPTVRGLGDRIAQSARVEDRESEPPIAPLARTSDLPLSFSQERLWFLDRFQPGTAYNMPVVLRLAGDLNLPALAGALAEIVRRHEALRTTFPERAGRPRQVIAAPAPVPLPVLDLAGLPAGRREAELSERLIAEIRRPFDLRQGPLLCATLLRLGARDHALALATHHIVCDAWSIGIFERELSVLYAVAARGERSPLPELPVQYADFAVWQRRWMTGERLSRLAAAWRARLAGAPAGVELPVDRPYPPAQTFRGGSIAVRLRPDLASRINHLARREGASLFMTLLAAFQTLLHRYSGQEDPVVGTPIAGRSRPEVEGLIGVFLNVLALRGDLAGDPSFRELLARARETALATYALQDLPFEKLLEELQPPRNLSRPPLFQTMLILQNASAEALTLQGLSFTLVPVETGTAKLELLLTLGERGGEIAGFLEYNADLFDRSTGERLVRHLENLLAGAAGDPDLRLSDLPLLSAGEREQVLREWNDTTEAAPAVPVHRLFAAQAARTPDAPAVADAVCRLTYRELDERANRLAAHLVRLGVRPEALVGVCLERSADMVTALLGVLKAGGAYLPLDPSYPEDRLRLMMEDSDARFFLGDGAGALSAPGLQVVRLDDPEIGEAGPRPPHDVTGPSHLAYVLYTSGSTGRPKGVQVTHGALANFLAAMLRRPGLNAGDVLLATTSLSFDIAGLEVYLPLLAGARLVIARREEVYDSRRLGALLGEQGATVMQGTPSTWRLLVESGWTGSPGFKVLCGGEALPANLAAQLLERAAEVWNLYGPTETTIWSAVERLAAGRPVSIGRPIANTETYIVDPRLAPAPVGVTGELWIGGAGLSRGYLGRPDLTAERFVPDPFGPNPGSRLYRTGDLTRHGPDGRLEHLGRLDQQVKVRGFRIEPGEVEAALCRHPQVAQAAVVARAERTGDAYLVAYLVPRNGIEPSHLIAEARESAARTLPPYMIPSSWVVLSELPLTPNGKLDRRALPRPERPAGSARREAPRSTLERTIAEIWLELLDAGEIGVEDNFFDIGGHSLLMPRLQSRLRERLGREIGIVELFRHATIRSLAQHLSAGGDDEARRPEIERQDARSDRGRARIQQLRNERRKVNV